MKTIVLTPGFSLVNNKVSVDIDTFPGGEEYIRILDDISGEEDVMIFSRLTSSKDVMRLFMTIDALRAFRPIHH